MISDSELLKRYADGHDEAAFAELVRRHVNHVYSAGLRLVGGDRHLAEDIAQTVFTSLARKAHTLRECRTLSGWLHTSARFAAANLVRAEQRRRSREQEASPMLHTLSEPAPDWDQTRAVLDETIGELNEADREALLLRYFETKPFSEIGSSLGVTENAARMRVERAVDKLRTRLALRGITSTAAALGTALAQFAVVQAPATLGPQIAGCALAAVAGRSVLIPSRTISTAVRVGVVGVLLVGAFVATVTLKKRAQRATPAGSNAVEGSPQAAIAPAGGLGKLQQRPAQSGTALWQGLELFFVDAANGTSVSNQLVTLKSWDPAAQRMVERELDLQQGRCEVSFEPEPWGDHRILICHVEGFADARLRWSMNDAEPYSASQLVRLVRPTPIGGRVLDPSGRPVAGAIVGVSTDNFPPSGAFSEDHCLDYTPTETDSEGRWRLNRVAPEMVGRISVEARHPDYADSEMVTITRRQDLLEDLLKEKLVLQLGNGTVVHEPPADTNRQMAMLIRGSVVDTNHQPIAGARIRAGTFTTSRATETIANQEGSFEIAGWAAGEGIVTAEAEGFAPRGVALKVAPDLPPTQIILNQGRALRLLITDALGTPVPQANLILQSRPHVFPNDGNDPVPQISFHRRADKQGLIVWANAPEQKLDFSVGAEGYLDHHFEMVPDGEEHVIILQRALLINGTVRDSLTGEIIPRFRLGIGYPQKLADGSMRPAWVPLDRYWINFTHGKFRKILTEPAISVPPNAGYFFRFEAEGHAAFVTRWFAPDEGAVQLEVALEPVEDIVVIVYSVEGKPAADAQMGFLLPGTDARLVPGGFDFMLGNAPVWVRRADPMGRFRVPGGEKIERVVVAAPGGYAEISVEVLRKAGAVRLEAWARLEGKLEDHGLPVAKTRLQLGMVAEGQGTPLQLDTRAFEAITDDEGHFVFPKVPPGFMHVDCVEGTSFRIGATIQAQAGKITEVSLAR